MTVSMRNATLIEQAKHQADHGEYNGAWSTYRDLRESLNEDHYDAERIATLDETERAAETSFRAGRVGFESELYTLLFIAQRLVGDAETGLERQR